MIDYSYTGKDFYVIHECEEQLLSLDVYLKDNQNWSLKYLWNFATQILSALLTLENHNLIYGSLNFGNIFVNHNNEIRLVKALLPVLILKQQFKRFQVYEDCIFLSPEFMQRQTYTIKSDIYSFGILLYFLFTKKWPYPYTSKVNRLKTSLLNKPELIQTLNPNIPKKIALMIHRCIAPNAEQRFSSFLNLVNTYKLGELNGRLEANLPGDDLLQHEIKEDVLHSEKSRFWKKVQWGSFLSFLIILFVLSYGVYHYYVLGIPNRLVPNLRGLEMKDGLTLLKSHQLKGLVAGERIHPFYPPGLIVDQTPASGREVKQNRTIKLFISKGKQQSLVPDLVGRPLESVSSTNEALDIYVKEKQFSNIYPPGIVIHQQPTPNSLLGIDEQIRVIVSQGYPIDIAILGHIEETNKVTARVSFSILHNWKPQEVAIYYRSERHRQRLYSDVHFPDDKASLEFELDQKGFIEVYFDEELAEKNGIKTAELTFLIISS